MEIKTEKKAALNSNTLLDSSGYDSSDSPIEEADNKNDKTGSILEINNEPEKDYSEKSKRLSTITMTENSISNNEISKRSPTVRQSLKKRSKLVKNFKKGVKINKKAKSSKKKKNSNLEACSRKYLVAIKSNIWGTKFKFCGQNYLQNTIGQITYKTSLFHLQPRQMKIILDDLSLIRPLVPTNSNSVESNKESTECESIVKEEEELENFKNEIKSAGSSMSPHTSETVGAKKNLNELISIKTSATLGAIPDIMKEYDSISTSSLRIIKSSSQSNGSFEVHNCNDEIATVQGLVENKFSHNSTGDFFEKFNLPVLKLTNDNLDVENYLDNNLITSETEYYEENTLEEIGNNEEIHLLASSTRTLANTNCTTPATTTTTSLTTTIYPKYHLKNSKFNLINKLNRNGEFSFTSNQFFNFLLNRKVLEKSADYQRLDEKKDFNSMKVKSKGKNNSDPVEKQHELEDIDEIKVLDTNESAPAEKQANTKKRVPLKNQFVLHNKPPIWNETNQVYQLDFGGRVTQESAKNFQIEFNGKQVMQFGRIDPNGYTLDFEWPFTAVQAFSIALANITQRFK